MIIASFIFSALILQFNGLLNLGLFYVIMISLLFSLIPPILTFGIVSIAKNKIEAATLYKGLSMFLVLPIVAFFIQNQWKYSFGIIPFFWTFNAFKLNLTLWPFIFNFCIGVGVHLIFITLFYRIYKRKI